MFYCSIPVIQLGVAYNRVIAIYVPFRYKKLCSKLWASIVIALGLSYGTLVSLHELIANCHFGYNPFIFSWEYFDCTLQVVRIKLIYPMLFMTGMTLTLNLFVATRIVIEKIGKQSLSESKKKNIKLFWQAFIQEMFFVSDCLSQHFLYDVINTRLWLFLTNTFLWELSHTCDGLSFLLLNVALRNSLRNLLFRYIGSDSHSRSSSDLRQSQLIFTLPAVSKAKRTL
ncbi:hypothetical protein Y032_0024g938 [Ancylostoma ceylanicum]|nr:hypothetical protein Y032_0024g938 [Ancylostoma ceylanicum]